MTTREAEALAPLAPGTYPIISVAFDVPEREQGSESSEVSGEVVFTRADDDLVSGHMTGWGGGFVESHFSGEDLGLRYKVVAMEFENLPGAFVGEGP